MNKIDFKTLIVNEIRGGVRENAGRPAFDAKEPITEEERLMVVQLSANGVPQEDIGTVIRQGISVETLVKYFSRELKLGKVQASANIGGRLYSKAMAGDTAALIWWTKAQMRWRETKAHEISGPGGGPVEYSNFNSFYDDGEPEDNDPGCQDGHYDDPKDY